MSMGIFSNAQGKLAPQAEVKSGRISNLSETLWLSLLPARTKKIQSKMKELVVTTLLIDFSGAQGQLTP